jgi:hypothetical protein
VPFTEPTDWDEELETGASAVLSMQN